jgi:methyl-accepting chemotaxis protein PixJ
MNQTEIKTQPARSTPLESIRVFVRNNLFGTVTATMAGSLLLTGVSTWNIWNIYNSFQSTVAKQIELQQIDSDMIYQDEVLTMSALMFTRTGDKKWEARYNKFVPTYDALNKKFLANIPEELRLEAGKTDGASTKLFAFEDKAFKLANQGKSPEAFQIMVSNEYNEQKKIQSSGYDAVLAKVDRLIKAELQHYQDSLLSSIIFASATLPVLLVTWIFVLAAIRDYIHDRQAAAAMAVSRAELLQVNDRLNQEVDTRLQQERQIRLESELLQSDVSHILDVVCSLEEGDLTVKADVNERATGLVSDTLNRLTESLDRIVSAVVAAAEQVTTDTSKMALTAVETAQQAQFQATEVQSVQSLMNSINSLTTDSRQQAIATATAVQQAKSAVISGKQAIQSTTDGIGTLQQGTNQIVRRSELLTEFVDLAAQFSKEQKRVAALTRVLALNVSTLSSRAMQERNPEQFASLAKEFETIAIQVSSLATDTNQSLASLQQRTDRVQTVTSGLTQDIGDINLLVQKFTTEIGKTSQAFDNIQSVTDRVAEMSNQVNSSSQDIVRVVSDALTAIESISTAARSTEANASMTREQVQSMGDLADKLLGMVEFFKLSQSTTALQPAIAQLTAIESGELSAATAVVYQQTPSQLIPV